MRVTAAKEIDLGNGFGDVAVKANGIRVELHADGSVAAYTQKDVDAYTNGAVHVHPAANDRFCEDVPRRSAPTASCAEPEIGPEIGDVMPVGHPNAGWIYVGTDEKTGKDFYAAPKDESGTFTFNQAARRASSIGAKVPSQSQLDKMYRNKDNGALKGTFNVTGSYPSGWYWSSSQFLNYNAWAQRFSDGYQFLNFKLGASSLRCVR